MTAGTVFFMYHELQLPGRELCESEPGYVRYTVAQEDFREQLARLRAHGLRGMSVGEALRDADQVHAGVVITFDDGCETDLIAAAPLLKEAHCNATFYVTVGHLGRRGYLSERQLREFSDLGFEIGSHSATHSYLPDLSADRLHAEVAGSKEHLEQLTGRPVAHFSCPGGRWSRRVARAARAAGYESVATSRIGANARASDRYCLARVPVMRGMSLAEFDHLCHSQGLLTRQARAAALATAKRILGDTAYEKIRALVLG